MKKTSVALAASLFAFSSVSFADIVGATLEATYWQAAYSGTAVSGNTELDFEDDLGFDDSGFMELAVAVEHPVPVLPNVKIRHINMDETEQGSVPTISFGGVSLDSDVETNLDLTHTDLVLYYEILDNFVDFSIAGFICGLILY